MNAREPTAAAVSGAGAYRAIRDSDPAFDAVSDTPVQTPPRPALLRSVSEHTRLSPVNHGNGGERASLPGAEECQSRSTRPRTLQPTLPGNERHTITMDQLPSFVRELSLLVSTRTSVQIVQCYICFEDVALAETVKLSACGHRFCGPCFKAYLELKISEGNVYPVCFHPIEIDNDSHEEQQRACGAAVATEHIEELVSADSFEKLTRFRFNRENEYARECPYCSHAQLCPGPQAPTCTCENCTQPFCFLHGNAHPDGSCADYELRHAETEAMNHAKIKEISKPCPGCHRDVEKNGGCNHMRCIACHTHFCWLCGEMVEDAIIPSHYNATNGGACSGRQFDGVETPPPTWWMRVYIVLAIVVCGLPAVLIGTVVTPFVWCWKPQEKLYVVFEGVVTTLAVLLQAPLAVPYFLVVLSLVEIAHCIRFIFRSARRKLCSARQPVNDEPLADGAPPNDDLETGNAVVRPPPRHVDEV